jgi:hypothetical protein
MSKKGNEPIAFCSNCGAQLKINGFKDFVYCENCGAKHSVSELFGKSNSETTENKKQENDKSRLENFKKSKFSKVLIAFFAISFLMCALAFANGQIIAGIVAIAMTALFLISWLMGMQIIKEKKKSLRTIATTVAFILIIPYCMLFNTQKANTNKAENFVWSDIKLSQILPEPQKTYGEIINNSQTTLSLYVYNISKTEYKDYISECETYGFTIDCEKSENNYSAYNSDGYELSLWYNYSDKELNIHLDAPREMSKFEWPSSGIASLLPAPNSTIGDIYLDNSNCYIVYVGGTSKDEYNKYVKSCSNAGFNVNYNKGDDYYYADNQDGYHLKLNYKGNNIMYICIDSDVQTKESVNTTEPKTTQYETATQLETTIPVETTIKPESTKAPETTVQNKVTEESKATEKHQTSNITENNISDTVYITPSGSKYHTKDCRTIKDTSTAISRSDAESQGYSACKICKP